MATIDISDAHFVSGIMNHLVESASVAAWAAGLGFADLLFPTDLLRIPGFSLANYWLAPPREAARWMDEIEDLHGALDDDESRQLLRSLVLYRLTSDPRLHPEIDVAGAYKPSFLPIFDDPITFVDAGAFTGDSFESLLQGGVQFADWLAFEPDPRNMEVLARTARRHQEKLPSYTLMAAGLSDANRHVRFTVGDGLASRILTNDEATPSEYAEIHTVRLDDVVRRPGPLYIKMDIEGAELAAVNGMSDILRGRPVMAVSIYHRPQDLWEIPKRIRALYDSPRMRIRQHGHHAFDTVLYVSPA